MDDARRTSEPPLARPDRTHRLTLGRLAEAVEICKPVVYDHFPTRSLLLIEFYRAIDTDRVTQFETSVAGAQLEPDETAQPLASAYIRCASPTGDEFAAVGQALGGSPQKAEIFRELLANSVRMFSAVPRPYCTAAAPELHRYAVALVGAGESLLVETKQGGTTQDEAIESFAHLIRAGLRRD